MGKIKVLFYGDSPSVATGFGSVSRNILTSLQQTGKYDIAILGVNYFGEPHPMAKRFDIFPVGVHGKGDPYGRQYAAEKMRDLNYDVLFMIQDSFILSFMESALPQLHSYGKKISTVMYYPVDGVPKAPWIKAMALADIPVTYTQFAYNESVKAHPQIKNKLRVIPHGVNTNEFFPLPKADIDKFRKDFFQGHAGKYIVSNVNRNQPRKDFPRSLMAFKEFKKLRPNSIYYAHCARQDMGWDLTCVVENMGLKLDVDVAFPGNFGPNQGYPVEILNMIYNASDLLVSSTIGEGWGLSATEAMATKTPILFPNNTSLTEIIGEDRGYLINSGANVGDWAVLSNDNDVVRPLVSVEDMIEKMVYIHDNREEAAQRAENAYKWVISNLQWDKHIVPQWDRILQEAYSLKAKPVPALNKSNFISGDEL